TWHWLIIGIVLAGVVLRVAFALLPLSQHLLLLEDDAWMVTAIARNWAMGKGITADGINPTNGFHPLYPLTLGAMPYVFAPNNLAFGFNANLVICALLASLVMLPLWKLMHHLAGERAALIALALYALNPVLIRLTVNGMETSMALLLWTTTLWTSVTFDLTKLKTNVWLAVITAGMILTRLDGALLFAAIAAARFLWAWKDKRLKREFPLLTLYVTLTFALLIPYFWRNLSVFGSFSPSSGQALTYLHSYADSYALSNGIDGWYVNSAFSMDVVGRSVIGALVWLGIFAAFVIWAVRRDLWRLLALVLYMPIPLVYYGYMMQQDNPRHFVPFSLAIIIFLAWALARLWQRQPQIGRILSIAVPILILAVQILDAGQFWQQQRTTASQTQPTMYQAALWMRDNLPTDALIGAKNSGIYQYYSGHTVINIDGKLNQDILQVYEQRRMLDYLHEKKITYLVDREATMADHVQFYSSQFGDRPLHNVPTTLEQFRIYGTLLLKSLGLGAAPQLDRRDGFVPNRPFSDVATVIKTFPRPNDPTNPVVVFELK
ncbi:MAG: glycosyltransferase family 39 protein, partial [Herpetosiphon sp.]|nr:glycosyltransferase family 39 protein [Herpetosiphon sp.]